MCDGNDRDSESERPVSRSGKPGVGTDSEDKRIESFLMLARPVMARSQQVFQPAL